MGANLKRLEATQSVWRNANGSGVEREQLSTKDMGSPTTQVRRTSGARQHFRKGLLVSLGHSGSELTRLMLMQSVKLLAKF
jgi:hypothetical protein